MTNASVSTRRTVIRRFRNPSRHMEAVVTLTGFGYEVRLFDTEGQSLSGYSVSSNRSEAIQYAQSLVQS